MHGQVPVNNERSLLVGAIAVRIGLITQEEFSRAATTWARSAPGSLADVLRDQGFIRSEDILHLDYLVERRVSQCGGDVRACFSGYSAEIQAVLANIRGDTRTGHWPGTQDTIVFEGDILAPVPETPAKPGGRYTLNTLHAAGGIGEIWLARDVDLQRDVAIKRLQADTSTSPLARTRFLREARITGQLDHPGVVPIYEICMEADGQPYYSMRFLNGRTLTEAVKEYHRARQAGSNDSQMFLTLLGAFGIVCNTVAYAHSRGIIHRDLKCDNVILGDYGEVVVIDWGLARQLAGDDTAHLPENSQADLASIAPVTTLAGHILGTPAYMSPEQALGRLDLIDTATDIYGLCAILYEILTGRPPFVGNNTLEVLHQVERQEPIRPSEIAPGVPETLEQICLKGLAKAKQERHTSADVLARAVQTWVSDLAERRQAEEERERFFALSLDLLAILDADGRFHQVGPAWQRLLGYDCIRLTERPFLDFVHPDDRTATAGRLHDVAANRAANTFEARVLTHAGSYRWVSWNITRIARENCVYVVGRDITELKKSQQLFQGVLQSAPDAMVLLNPLGRIVLVNSQTERIFGYTADELFGQPVEILIPERFRANHPAHVAGFFAASSVRPMGAGLPLRGLRKDGTEFLVDIALSPIATEDGLLVAASVREIADKSR